MFNLTAKRVCLRNLMRLHKVLPNIFDFFPYTYILPADFREYLDDMEDPKLSRMWYIGKQYKTDGRNRKFLTRRTDNFKLLDEFIV